MKQLSRPRCTVPEQERDVEDNGKEETSIGLAPNKGNLRLIKDYAIDYTQNSNLHGLKYIGEKRRTLLERIFWAIMITSSVVLCAIMIRKIWIKWNDTPVIVTFAEKSTPVWQIPYPAVTICSENKAMPEQFNYTKYYHLYYDITTNGNLTEKEKNTFEHIAMVCGYNMPHAKHKNFSFNYIKEVAPTNEDIFLQCVWNEEVEYCEDFFFPILTEDGLCYTFNNMGTADLFREENLQSEYPYLEHRNVTEMWTLETGYSPSAPLETYPRRGAGSGLKTGLAVLLHAYKDDINYLCSGPNQGFKIYLHNPAELPRSTQHYISLPISQEVLIAVKPKIITTSEGLRPYDSERRQCYFQNQRHLLYYKFYTQSNCEMECLTNFTYVRCGCVHFGWPRGPNMKVCGPAELHCIRRARKKLLTIEIQSEMEVNDDNKKLGEARAIAAQCKCLPACTSIDYEAEMSQSALDWKAYFKALENVDKDDDNFVASAASIYFKEAQFITSRRSELYGQTDFLANCGGLLGLFMGFSILSVAEIVYFLTLRCWCLLRRHRAKNSIKNSKGKHAFD